MTTLSTTPTVPIRGRTARVSFALTGSGSNYLRAWLTDAPLGSELRDELKRAEKNRKEVYSGDTKDAWSFTPDVGGIYVLAAQEFTKGAGKTGGGYAGSPDGYTSEVAVGGEISLSVHVGQRLVTTVGVGADTAKLVVYILDGTIQRTLATTEGEATPALVSPSSPKARTATLDATVVAAVDALAGVAASAALGSLDDVLTDWRTNFNAHLTQTGVHYSNDADHNLGSVFDQTSAPQSFATKLNQARKLFIEHSTDDKPYDSAAPTNPYGVGVATYHQDGSGNNTADWQHQPIAGPAGPGDMERARALMADLWRCYEGHRVQVSAPPVHEAADTTNALAGLPKLLQVDAAFLAVLASQSPTAPATVNAGAVQLMHGAGFAE